MKNAKLSKGLKQSMCELLVEEGLVEEVDEDLEDKIQDKINKELRFH